MRTRSPGDPTIALQGQLVGQLNLNIQGAAAEAEATSGDVTVEQSGALDTGGNGIVAESNAAAAASLEQSADQDNENSVDATLRTPEDFVDINPDPEGTINLGAAALQAQLLGQFNLNGQFGLAEAEATSGDVSVTSFIPKDPTVGSGIIAESNAAASATLDQTVEQENTNSASITLPPLTVIDPQDEQVLPDLEIAAQLEGVLQVNASLQAAEADATATSGDVDVDQSGSLSSGVDGIVAQSNAAASAELDQSATQTNSDSKDHQQGAERHRGHDLPAGDH